MYLVYKGFLDRFRRHYFRKLIRKYAVPESTLLDYGCGPGDALQICNSLGIRAYGIDAFERSVIIARSRGLNVVQGDYLRMPFAQSSLDFILLQSVIEHMSSPIEAINILKRYLKPGGVLILSSPTPSVGFYDDPTHIRPHTPKSFAVIAELCELDCVEVNYVFSFLMNLRLKNALFYRVLNLIPISLGSNILGVYRKRLD